MNQLKKHKRLEEFVRLMWSHETEIKSYMPKSYPLVKYKNNRVHGDIISTAELCEIFVTSKDPLALKYCYNFGVDSQNESAFNNMIARIESVGFNHIVLELKKRQQKPYIDIQHSNLLKPRKNRELSNYKYYTDYEQFLGFAFLSGRAEGYKVDWELLQKAISTLDGKNSEFQPKIDKPKKDENLGRLHNSNIKKFSNFLNKTNEFDPNSETDALEKIERSIALRRGQSGFRQTLIEIYDGKCAITGCDVIEALEAAHIMPYKGEYWNHPTNGILMRADIHTLFDLGLITINPDDNFKVCLSLDLLNSSYSHLQVESLNLPSDKEMSPNIEALRNHYKQNR